jgi:hypothetical protein
VAAQRRDRSGTITSVTTVMGRCPTAKNRVVLDGNHLTLPVLAGTVSGSAVIVGMIPGVVLPRGRAPATPSSKTDRVWLVSVAGAVTAVGLRIYVNSRTYALIVVPAFGVPACSRGNVLIRRAAKAQANAERFPAIAASETL